ncbi:helix-turn-helix domain-containing protein [Citrobacter braakii]
MDIEHPDRSLILSATAELLESLAPLATFAMYPPNTRLYLYNNGVAYCYLVRSGVCNVYHQTSEILLGTLYVPGIMGLSGTLYAEAGMFIQTHSTSEIAVTRTDKVNQFVTEHNLWRLLACHSLRVTSRLYTINTRLMATCAYEIVRVQLQELMSEPAEYRHDVSAAQYIQQKTSLSRSSIMKILAQLKKGGYISIENGILMTIEHLPLKY